MCFCCCFSKAVCWSSPSGMVFFKGSYSTGRNYSLSDNITTQILMADNLRCVWIFFSCVGGWFLPGLSIIFVGHLLPLSGSLSPKLMFFGCGPGETQGRVCLCGFRSCILSHSIPDRSPYIHTFCPLFSLNPSFPFCL